MKKYIFFFICFFGTNLFAQQAPPTGLPKIFPASPEASTLGRFGEIPINTAIGMLNFSVPIYNIQESGFSLPISVNYQHNGLVVDQIPGHLGMGWNLSAGGMITRQVRGRPDEDDAGYIGNQMTGINWVLPYINNQLTSTERLNMEQVAEEGLIDTQPDKFIVNVGNLNATFYFDENRTPLIKPYKPYLIEVINNDYSFLSGIKITDDSGIEYYFQELERTKRIPPLGLGEIPTALLNGYTSGWKISEIKLTNNKSIHFTYDGQLHFQRTKSQSYKQRTIGSCGQPPASTSTRDYQINSKIINEISFPKGKIVFDNSIVSIGGANNNNMNTYLSYLNKIELKSNNNDTVSTFDLSYDDINKTRKLLTQIKLNSDVTNTYVFEYNGTPIDNIDWAKQDFWGYYNNNPTNHLINDLNSWDLYGNRKPDFEKSKLGSLIKITYPTKGFTEITYESNTFDPGELGTGGLPYECQSANMNTVISKNIHLNWLEQNNGTNYNSTQVTFTIQEPYLYADLDLRVEKLTDPFLLGQSDGSIYGRVKARIGKTSGIESGCGDQDCYGSITPPLGKLGCEGTSVSIGGPTHFQAGIDTYNRRVKLDPGEYTLFIEVENYGVLYDVGDILKASATVQFFEDDGSPPIRSLETGGIRISKIKSCPDNNPANCTEKQYIYETSEEVSKGQLFRKRNITSYDLETVENAAGGGICNSFWKIHSSSSNVPLSFYMGSHVFYNEVTEKLTNYNGTSLGYIEKNYTFNQPQQNLTFPFIAIDNKEFVNGNPLSEKTYDNSNNLVAETTYSYDFGNTNLNGINQEVYSLSVGAFAIRYVDGGDKSFTNNVTVFRNETDRNWLTGVTKKELRDGIFVETNTSNTYKNPQGHIETREVQGSDGLINKAEFEYPYDFNSGVYNTLINKNRLSTPVQTRGYKQGNLLSTTKTIYENWNGGITEPKNIQTSKNSESLEDRLIYHNYDDKGNPLEVSKADGTHIVYIWGYNQQYPIAKIENATYSQVQSYVTNLQNLSDLDINEPSENSLKEALNNLRVSLPNTMTTTHTYNPLIGVTSITDPRGYTIYYEYDEFNRLKQVKDAQGKILSKNEYHFKD